MLMFQVRAINVYRILDFYTKGHVIIKAEKYLLKFGNVVTSMKIISMNRIIVNVIIRDSFPRHVLCVMCHHLREKSQLFFACTYTCIS